jgi:hypothetical protein
VVTVIAQPPDPRCPGYALVEPRVADLPSTTQRVALDVSFTDPLVVTGTAGGAVVAEERAARVSVAVISRPSGAMDEPAAMLSREGSIVEALALGAMRSLGSANSLIVGRTAQLRTGASARRTTLRLLSDEDLPVDRVRSDVARALVTGAGAIASGGQMPARAFIVEVTTVVLPAEGRVVVFVGVAPEGLVDDVSQPTAIRLNDVVNATGLGAAGERLDTRCHQVRTTRTLSADFLWFVDTSGSMNDDQERVGRTGSRFFSELTSVGVDFRVGVFQAGTSTTNLVREPGTGTARSFAWIPGTAADGAQQLAHQVTEDAFEMGDTRRPYRMTTVSGQDEQPTGAAVMAYEEFSRRASLGERNPQWRLRDGAVRVAFLVTDEPGGPNDIGRFFFQGSSSTRWGSRSDIRTVINNVAAFFRRQGVVPFGLVPNLPTASGAACPSEQNFAQCVILAAGGAFIPIEVADAREADRAFTTAMSRIVDSVAGAGSEFVLPTIPVSATLRARVGGALAPRSRQDGFDYEDRSSALIFRGARFRPMVGQDVRAAYFVWTRE